ncbi:ABC transporter permease [Tepidiforma flava]|uniref:ABC transporter permease n=1 Tax=Tepidiforma flava TaxID=3004094 RepID=UPI003570CB0B
MRHLRPAHRSPRPLPAEPHPRRHPPGPSAEHWLGTDALGRDLASRVIYAARTTVVFTIVVLISGSLVLGLGLGLLAGYRGGWVDTLIMRVGEVLAGLPTLLLMLAITAAFRTRINDVAFWLQDNTFLGSDARTFVKFSIIVFATVPFAWIGTSRIVRSQALAIREETYVLAAEAMGASSWRIIFRHILPGVLPLFVVGVSAGMAGTAGAEVTLSFLGLGIDPPTASFGSLIAAGAGPQTFERYPHLLLAPAIPVTLFFFAWNLLGDALVDLLEPRTQALR